MFTSAAVFLAIGLVSMAMGVGIVAGVAVALAWVLFAIGLMLAAEHFVTDGDTNDLRR
ncbi:MAG: hypothetical protein R3E68_07770 [Burkholderiaceae bacterium]